MTNTNIQGPINLFGRGLVNKPTGHFEPGEFSRARNIMYASGEKALQTRDGITPATGFTAEYRDARLVGAAGAYLFFVDYLNQVYAQYAFLASAPVLLFDLDTYVLGGKLCGVVEYGTGAGGKPLYFFTVIDPSPTPDTIHVLWKEDASTAGAATDLGVIATFDTSISTAGMDIYKYSETSIIFKDRMWFVYQDGVYYSKATDPKTWAVPDGGFIKFPEEAVTDIVGIRDTLYIFTTNNVYVLTYSSDPGSDGSLRSIYEGPSGKQACIAGDSVFFATEYSLFYIANYKVSEVFAFEEIVENVGYGVASVAPVKLVSYDGKLYIVRAPSGVEGYGNTSTRQYVNADAAVLVYDLETGFVSSIDFETAKDLTYNSRGQIQNAVKVEANFFITSGDKLVFLVNRYDGAHFQASFYQRSGVLNYKGDDAYNKVDRSFNSTMTTLSYFPIDVQLEIPSYVPDGNEYHMKKFRHLLMQAYLPESPDLLSLSAGIDGGSALTTVTIHAKDPATAAKFDNAFMFKINKRGRSLYLKIFTNNVDTAITDYVTFGSNNRLFKIYDLRTIWSYTQRLPIGKGATG